MLLGRSGKGNLEIWDVRLGRRVRTLPPAGGVVFWIEPHVLLACTRDSVRRIALG